MNSIPNDDFIGITFGTCKINIGIYLEQKFEIIKTNIPPIIIFEHNKINFIDKSNIYQKVDNYENIIYDIRRLIGLNYEELIKKDFYKNLTYEIINDNGIPKIKINNDGKYTNYSVEEICSFIFKGIIKFMENFLSKLGKNIKKANVLITVPKYYSSKKRESIESAVISTGIEKPKIIDEPFGEIIGYALGLDLISENKNNKKEKMIFDLGGGKTYIELLNFFKNDKGNIELKIENTECDINLGEMILIIN